MKTATLRLKKYKESKKHVSRKQYIIKGYKELTAILISNKIDAKIISKPHVIERIHIELTSTSHDKLRDCIQK